MCADQSSTSSFPPDFTSPPPSQPSFSLPAFSITFLPAQPQSVAVLTVESRMGYRTSPLWMDANGWCAGGGLSWGQAGVPGAGCVRQQGQHGSARVSSNSMACVVFQ